MFDPPMDDFEDTTVDLNEASPADTDSEDVDENGTVEVLEDEANLILIAHPDNRSLGRRYRLTPGTSLEIGRSRACDLGFPEVLSLSRSHGRLHFSDKGVFIEDLGSTNGSFVNDRRVQGRLYLRSGDRLQLGALHFKFLHGRDVEHAYYEAIFHLMTEDGLTEIFNRRTFEEEFHREFYRAKRHRRPLSLILFDIDHFKLVNDRCGHLCGDFVLKGIVNITRQMLRPEQVFARVGGDEFAILNPETELQGSVIFADKLRVRISEHEFDPDLLEGRMRVTCSFGIADLDEKLTSTDQFYSVVDRCLYRSKEDGRNRVTVNDWDEPIDDVKATGGSSG